MNRLDKPTLAGLVFKALSGGFRYWLIILVIASLVNPVGPHLRWSYSYIGHYSDKTYVRCDYVGSRGILEDVPHLPPKCPMVVILDTRRWQR